MQRTLDAVSRQIFAMSSPIFEVGLFKPHAEDNRECVMIPRTWDAEHLLKSVSWMRLQNLSGRNIYVRPAGEHNLTLVDDLKASSLRDMATTGFKPALVVETSPDNFQAWLKHSRALSKEVSTAAAKELAAKFDGDTGAADWRHFGRLAGFTNRKPKYQNPDGMFPFVKLSDANGRVYDRAEEFISQVEARVCQEREKRHEHQRIRTRAGSSIQTRTIEQFQANPAYGGDKTRSDLAYAIYSISHGMDEAVIASILRNRDLTHKGNEKRQVEYVDRTIKKARAAADRAETLGR